VGGVGVGAAASAEEAGGITVSPGINVKLNEIKCIYSLYYI
jgi:hypothetical protein